LLIVFLAKERDVRLHDIEDPQNHGGHAAKMPGPLRALPNCGDVTGIDEGRESGGKDLLHRRRQDGVYFGGFQQLEVLFRVARITREIFRGAELGGVHKDGNNHHIALYFCLPDKAEVSFVKRAHGRNQGQGF